MKQIVFRWNLAFAMSLVVWAGSIFGQPIDSLRAVLPETKGVDRVAVCLQLARHFNDHDWEQSVSFAKQALDVANSMNHDSLIFESNFELSKSYRGLGDLEQALHAANNALAVAFDHHSRASAIGLLGRIREGRSEYELALGHFLEALRLYQQTGDKKLEASTLNNMSFVYKDMGQFQKAVDVLNEAGRLYAASGNKDRVAGTRFNIGLMNMEMKQYDSAVAYFRSAVAGMSETSEPAKFSSYYNNLANCYEELIKTNPTYPDSALYYGGKNLVLKTKLNDYRGIANANNTLAAIYERLSNHAMAYQHARAALRLADSLQMKRIKKNALDYLITAEIGLKKTDELNAHFVAFTKLSEELNKEAHSRTLTEMSTKYETEKKEAENQRWQQSHAQQALFNRLLVGGGIILFLLLGLLAYFYRGSRQANARLALQNKQIETNLHEKEALLREIHHRVKNNLQVISSLLNMQSHHVDDPRFIHAMAEGQNRVKAMALIHQKLYQTEQLSEIDFQEYTEQLLQHLSAALGEPGKKIRSLVNGSSLKLDIDTAIPLGLILNELITNAYKYAFKESSEGSLQVILQRDDTACYHLRISDSGSGLPANFEEAHLNSLGLKLVRMLIEQLEGTLTISNEPGASFYIRFRDTRLTA